jgi:hypothetical protein
VVSTKYSLGKSFLVVIKVIMRLNLRSPFVSSLFEIQIYSISYIYYYSNVRLNKETDFYFLIKFYFRHVSCLINVDI